KGPEASASVTGQSEGRTRLSVLCAIRQDLSSRHTGSRLCPVPRQARRSRCGCQTFEDIESYGTDRWLGELAQALKDKTYRPEPVRRVWIDKVGGKKRPLGIPTI